MSKKKEFVGGYVEPSLKEKLQTICDKEERSMNYILEKILALGVRHLGKGLGKGRSKKAA